MDGETYTMTRRQVLGLGRSAALSAAFAVAVPGTRLPSTALRPATARRTQVTLTFGWWSNSPLKDAAFRAWLRSYTATHPSVIIQPEILPWPNYWDKLRTAMAAGSSYDLVGLSSSMAAPYLASDQLLDMRQLPGFHEMIQHQLARPLACYRWNGKQYGVPLGIALRMIGYNKDLFSAAGLPLPRPTQWLSFAAFTALAKELTIVKKGTVVQYGFHPSGLATYQALVATAGGAVFDRMVNPTRTTINTPAGIRGLAAYRSLFSRGIVPPIDHLSNDVWASGDLPSLQTGKVAMSAIGPWDFGDIVAQSEHLPIGIFPGFMIKQPVQYASANGLGISKHTSHAEEAWAFVRWATQTSEQLRFATFSDLPSNRLALQRVAGVIRPSTFAPTVSRALASYQPGLETVNQQLPIALNQIATDMVRGAYTPAQAAAMMETQGNALLASNE